MNATATTRLKTTMFVVALALILGLLGIPAGEAGAKVLTIGATVSDTSDLTSTHRDGANGPDPSMVLARCEGHRLRPTWCPTRHDC